MSLKPKPKKPATDVGMVQMNGVNGKAEKILKGSERIFSRQDTKKIVQKAKVAEDENMLYDLGSMISKMIEKQDKLGPEYTTD